MSSSTVEAGPIPGLASGTRPSFAYDFGCRFGITAGCRTGKLGVEPVFQIKGHPLADKAFNGAQIIAFFRTAE